MKKILVAVDFSDASQKAADYAAQLAKWYDASLVLIHAYYIPTPIGDAPGYMPLSIAEVQDENEGLLESETDRLEDKFQVSAEGLVKMGTASGVIKETAEEIGADMVVMGMKGAGQTAGIFGSTVTACIRKLKSPLLVIPQEASFTPMKHITFAADFLGKTNVDRFNLLAAIVQRSGAELAIVHVQKNDQQMDAGEIAGKIKTEIDLDKLNHSFHTVINDDIEKGIIDFMEKNPTEMLVMVAHHHTIFERIFGSVHTNLIAYKSKVPLMVLHD
jgi:nucleotide-binding universal stress UspA family protein